MLLGYSLVNPVTVKGVLVAIGVLLILAGDMRTGLSGDFRLALNETSIGLALPVTGLELAHGRLAAAMFQRATINAELFSPEDALLAGYLDRVEDPVDFDSAIIQASEILAALDFYAFAETKRRVLQSTLNCIVALES